MPKNCRFQFRLVTEKEVLNSTIEKLNTSKSPGYDDIQVSFIKDGNEQLSKPLTHLINKCLQQFVFQSSEKIAKVTPIYKSSEHNLLTNYRPISVLAVL